MRRFLSKQDVGWIGLGILLLGIGCMAFPLFYRRIVEGSPKTESQVMAVAISNAIKQFCVDSGQLPLVTDSGPAGDFVDTDTSTGNGLIATLLGAGGGENAQQNSGSINYIEGIKPAKPSRKDGNLLLNGLIYDRERKLFGVVDKWGTPYRIRLETNDDKEIPNPNLPEVAEGRGRLPMLVIVWSAGADRNWDTWKDNLKSWD